MSAPQEGQDGKRKTEVMKMALDDLSKGLQSGQLVSALVPRKTEVMKMALDDLSKGLHSGQLVAALAPREREVMKMAWDDLSKGLHSGQLVTALAPHETKVMKMALNDLSKGLHSGQLVTALTPRNNEEAVMKMAWQDLQKGLHSGELVLALGKDETEANTSSESVGCLPASCWSFLSWLLPEASRKRSRNKYRSTKYSTKPENTPKVEEDQEAAQSPASAPILDPFNLKPSVGSWLASVPFAPFPEPEYTMPRSHSRPETPCKMSTPRLEVVKEETPPGPSVVILKREETTPGRSVAKDDIPLTDFIPVYTPLTPEKTLPPQKNLWGFGVCDQRGPSIQV
eukprot:gnl/MRDRNA2_/MRDRNA2_255176_c0_seq1.p1 gnl/MRDRNA2_/MRDRNA2_255176_c0~~gnl/MRDRNA2_/MRDRNA2_255176_c0_seq1.p1  ORF type:complete len:348 (-),score=63.64 gnl/MRDRNA2_/MRDRNA2_255176_c0_seq1:14-1036(-)